MQTRGWYKKRHVVSDWLATLEFQTCLKGCQLYRISQWKKYLGRPSGTTRHWLQRQGAQIQH
eukprot:1269792-Amphidinium_carterae.1